MKVISCAEVTDQSKRILNILASVEIISLSAAPFSVDAASLHFLISLLACEVVLCLMLCIARLPLETDVIDRRFTVCLMVQHNFSLYNILCPKLSQHYMGLNYIVRGK